MKVLNEYPGSHHYWDEFLKCDYYCPLCGKQEVWQEQGGGDYYLGVEYICTNCRTSHHLDSVGYHSSNQESKIEQIKAGITKEPTTPRGG